MEQLIILIIFGAIAFFNWAIRQGSKGAGRVDKGSPPFTAPRVNRPRQIESTESEEERTRKFLEALGVPSTAQPPRRIVRPVQQSIPQVVPPIRRVVPVQIPERKAYVPPPPLPVAPRIPEPAMPVYTQAPQPQDNPDPASITATALGTVVPPSGRSSATVVQSPRLAELQSSLKSPASIRAAIILKEILGPPKGLQGSSGIPGLL